MKPMFCALKRERTLSFLVENCGRVNYGKALDEQRKGILPPNISVLCRAICCFIAVTPVSIFMTTHCALRMHISDKNQTILNITFNSVQDLVNFLLCSMLCGSHPCKTLQFLHWNYFDDSFHDVDTGYKSQQSYKYIQGPIVCWIKQDDKRSLCMLCLVCFHIFYTLCTAGIVGDILLNHTPLRGFTTFCLDMKPGFIKRSVNRICWIYFCVYGPTTRQSSTSKMFAGYKLTID